MKRKIFLTLVIAVVFALTLVLMVSAESVHAGKIDTSATVTLSGSYVDADGNAVTTVNLFDEEGNALIWFKNGGTLQSIRADDERVIYKCTYAFDVGNSTVGSVRVYEVSEMWINLDANTTSRDFVVLNLMDDDVLVNDGINLGKPVNCLKNIAWANKIIEYAYLRLDTCAVQAVAFCGCTKLKYVNIEDLTELRQIGGNQTFGQSPELFKGQALDLTGTKLCAISGNGAFNGVPVAEIKLPSTVTTLGEWNIQGTAITSFVFPTGVTTIAGSQFKNCASLKEIYINNTTTKINDNAFLSTNAFERIFFVGKQAELEALIANTSANGNSTFLAAAENIISYAEYQALEDKSGKYAVYGYSYCEAYNDGQHVWANEESLVLESYFSEIKIVDSCTVDGCDAKGTVDTIGALFNYYGYSYTEMPINGAYSMSQFYGINKDNVSAYVAYTGNTVEFGVVTASVDNPIGSEAEGTNKVIAAPIYNLIHDYFAIKVIGITEAYVGNGLVFCAYVNDNGSVYYLDNNTTSKDVACKSINDIKALDAAKPE